MTLEEAKEDYKKRAADFVREHGSVGLMQGDDGMIDIGNGHKVTSAEAHELMVEIL